MQGDGKGILRCNQRYLVKECQCRSATIRHKEANEVVLAALRQETDVEEEQTSISEEDEAILKEGGVIGIIEIPGLDIRYPVMEGTTSKVLNAGIGHIEETAGIGESGNCVLCGHNGSRYGTFFTPLSQISIGEEVMITDKNGLKHIYEVTEPEVVNPYDNSIKTQGDEKELTLFTCSQKGTMRFVVRCIYKEAVMDE